MVAVASTLISGAFDQVMLKNASSLMVNAVMPCMIGMRGIDDGVGHVGFERVVHLAVLLGAADDAGEDLGLGPAERVVQADDAAAAPQEAVERRPIFDPEIAGVSFVDHHHVGAREVPGGRELQSAGDVGAPVGEDLAPVGEELRIVVLSDRMGLQSRIDEDAQRRRRGRNRRGGARHLATPVRGGGCCATTVAQSRAAAIGAATMTNFHEMSSSRSATLRLPSSNLHAANHCQLPNPNELPTPNSQLPMPVIGTAWGLGMFGLGLQLGRWELGVRWSLGLGARD